MRGVRGYGGVVARWRKDQGGERGSRHIVLRLGQVSRPQRQGACQTAPSEPPGGLLNVPEGRGGLEDQGRGDGTLVPVNLNNYATSPIPVVNEYTLLTFLTHLI